MSLLGNIWVKLGLKSDDFNKGIDNAERKSSKFGNAMKSIAAKVLTVAAAFKIVAGTLKTLASFEASTSKLAAVLGKTTTEIKGLTQSAIDLGRKTQYTASEVVGLQTELAKLGFTEPQIKSMQESVLKFAAAVGTDLPSAAARAGATMRGFGLTAEETADMLNVMAISTSKSALSFSYLDSTLGKLVPVTKAYGFDTRDTITLLGTLANAGIDASSAGTALRRVFVELSNGSSKLNQAIGKQPKTMSELIDALDILNKKNLSVADSADLVGKFAAPAFAALVAGAGNCRELYGELQNVNGALDDMYQTMTHNVVGAVNELKSAWEGFILNLQGSNGVIARMVRGLTQLVNLANNALFSDSRIGENKSYFDLLWKGSSYSDQSFSAVQNRFAKERQRLERELGMTVEGTKSNRDIKEQLQGLEQSYADWFGTIVAQGQEAVGVIGDLGEETGAAGDGLGDLLKSISKENGLTQLTKEAAEYAKELKEVADEDELMTKQAEEMYKAIHKEKEGLDEVTQSVIAAAYGHLALLEMMEKADAAVDEGWQKWENTIADASRSIADALRSGALAALDELAEALGSGNWDTSALVKALVEPLADAAITTGLLIMTTGEGLEALKTAMLDLFGGGPAAAIFAGAGLMAIGVAAKAGLAAIVNSGGGGASGGSSSYSFSGGYGVNPMATGEGSIQLSGDVTVKGQDLHIALTNYENNRKR